MAVMAFRLRSGALAPGGGMLSTEVYGAVESTLLDDVEAAATSLVSVGLSTLPSLWRDGLARLEQRLRDAGLVWPAEILAELAGEYVRYTEHDARFAPETVIDRVGELLIRCDAIRAMPADLPQSLVRGRTADRVTAVGKGLYVGLGAGVRFTRAGVSMSAYLQDADSGGVVAVTREFADARDEDAAPAPPENPMSADRVRWEHIQRVFELCNHNVSETARRLNMHRRTLQRILAKRAPR